MASLGVTAIAYAKGEYVITKRDKMQDFFLIVSGEVHAYGEHSDGKRTVTMVAGPGDTFGLLFAYSDLTTHPSTAMAVRDTVILRFPRIDIARYQRTLDSHIMRTFIGNIVTVMSRAAYRARFKAFIVEHQTIASRVSAYLFHISSMCGKKEFDIPLDRKELADFINADRSALSVVLSKMKAEGLIEYRKSHFVIKKDLCCDRYV